MSPWLTTVPVFVLVLLGFVLQRAGGYSELFFRDCRRITYWIALPCVLFTSIATASLRESWHGGLAVVTLGASGLTLLAAGLLARRLCPDRAGRGAFLVSSFRGNFVYVGLPVILYAAARLPAGDGIEARAALLFAILVPFNNMLSVFLLSGCENGSRGASRQALAILGNPLVVGCAAGIAASLLGIGPRLPESALRSLKLIGSLAMPLALLSLGSEIRLRDARAHAPPVLAASLLKIGLCPLLGWWMLRLGVFSPPDRLIALVVLASPTAVAAYVMCDQMGANAKLSAGVVVVSTLASFVPLSLAAWAALG